MPDKTKGLTFLAIFNKATTTIDGGWNVTLSISQEQADTITKLAELRDTVLQVAIIPIESTFV